MKKGFTLIELVMVMVIIGILAVVAMPKFMNLQDQAKGAAVKGKLGAMRSGVVMYYASYAAANSGATSYPSGTDLSVVMEGGMPKNDVNNNLQTVSGSVPSANSSSVGWYYDTATGRVWAANDTNW